MITYEAFIQNILDTRGRFGIPKGEYKERHHIVPKCIGGTDDKDNLIDLYAREHYEAHRLLALENPDNYKLIYAWRSIAVIRPQGHDEEIQLTSDEYEELKIYYSKMLSETRSGDKCRLYGKPGLRLGKHHTDDSKLKMSESKKGKEPWNKGLTKETSDIIFNASIKFSDGCKQGKYKIKGRRNGMKGKHHSDYTKKLMSEAHSGVPKAPFTDEHKQHLSEVGKKLKWYTDGIVETRAEECPEGYHEGRCEYNKPDQTKYRWWTNGEVNTFCEECPKGFVKGMTRKNKKG